MKVATTAPHPFRTRPDAAHRRERAVFWVFRLATYFILFCGVAILGHIAIKGAGTVFQAAPPFINTTFLTAAPESLYVFEWQGEKMELGDREFRAFKAAHPAAASVKTE